MNDNAKTLEIPSKVRVLEHAQSVRVMRGDVARWEQERGEREERRLRCTHKGGRAKYVKHGVGRVSSRQELCS